MPVLIASTATPTAVPTVAPTPIPDTPSLAPLTILQFVNQLEKPNVYEPTLIKDSYGKFYSCKNL